MERARVHQVLVYLGRMRESPTVASVWDRELAAAAELLRELAQIALVVCDIEVQHCRSCGCTDDVACYDPMLDLPCHWVEADLCSACAPVHRPEDLVR